MGEKENKSHNNNFASNLIMQLLEINLYDYNYSMFHNKLINCRFEHASTFIVI